MLKRVLIGVIASVSLVLAGVIGWLIGVEFYPGRTAASNPPVLGRAPKYQGLTNQLGQSVDSARFAGKIRVVTFLFPYCTTYCPLIAAHLVGFEHLLQNAGLAERVQIVAFNVDPVGTGPKQMRAFLAEYHWNPKNLRWQYLTGKPQQIRRIVSGGYHIGYQKTSDSDSGQAQGPEQTPQPEVDNPLAKKAHVDYDISHNDGLVIVDAQGQIRKVYAQADTLSNQDLLEAIRPLLSQNGA